jgi:hypothetical protein
MSHARTHGGHAVAAKRRGEEWLTCTCTTHARPYRQASPYQEPPAIPAVRFVNIFLSAVLLWLVVIGWGLSLIGGAS